MWTTIGFSTQKKMFESLIQRNDLSHAYLFSGQEMIGKKTFGFELAQKLQPDLADSQIHPDLLLITPNSNTSISISEIRDAKFFASRSAYHGRFKIIIIDNAHLMTEEAQNALLKILEEPQRNVIFILVSSRPHMLFETIRSRCQEIFFTPQKRNEFDKYFETTDLSDKQKDFIYDFSHNSIGLAKISSSKKDGAELKKTISLLMTLIDLPLHERMTMIAPLAKDENLRTIVYYWILYIHFKSKLDQKLYKLLSELITLYKVIQYPQYKEVNALERFAINI